jgi:23S rRNA (cytidine1920-2'-O)/16S rRNA (cytidine1409-2'-O)-methyltransferase
LKDNVKIKSYENMNFKNVSNNLFEHHIDYVVTDVSFISLTKIIDKLVTLFNYRYKCIFLIKPQFELTPQEIKKGKVVKNAFIKKAINKIITYSKNNNFNVYGVIPSPIKGNKLGNQEFLIYMEKQ